MLLFGFRVRGWGLRFRVWGFGCRVWGSWLLLCSVATDKQLEQSQRGRKLKGLSVLGKSETIDFTSCLGDHGFWVSGLGFKGGIWC